MGLGAFGAGEGYIASAPKGAEVAFSKIERCNVDETPSAAGMLEVLETDGTEGAGIMGLAGGGAFFGGTIRSQGPK